MKKLMVIVFIIICSMSCSNPEDKATGNADSSSTGQGEVTNSRPGPTDPDGQTDVSKPDSSANTSTSKKNGDSTTMQTNRGYGAKDDTSKKKN